MNMGLSMGLSSSLCTASSKKLGVSEFLMGAETSLVVSKVPQLKSSKPSKSVKRGSLFAAALLIFVNFMIVSEGNALAATGSTSVGSNAAASTDKYKVLLYFGDSAPFEDELTLHYDENHRITDGRMHVPNDFDADIDDVRMVGNSLRFHLTLPPKYDQAFPGGLFYSLQFRAMKTCSDTSFCPDEVVLDDFIGHVTTGRLLEQPGKFVGYVVGFKKVDAL